MNTLHYLGYIIDANGIRPDPSKVEAIDKFSAPTNIKGVQRFLGMVNQLAKFIPNITEKTKPLRDLLLKTVNWTWTEVHEKAFSELKLVLNSPLVLAHYDLNKPVVLSADSSSYGMGAVLYQQTVNGCQPVAFASRSLQPAETRYATIEKESLAVCWACERFEQYLVGRHFLIQTDHKPLQAILKTKHLNELTPRLQRFKLRMLRFSYDIEYVPGKEQTVPDAMSRAPIPLGSFNQSPISLTVEEIEYFCNSVVQNISMSDMQLQKLKEAQNDDNVISAIKNYCTTTWPPTNELPLCHKIFASVQSDLTVINGILLKGERLVIPPSMRTEIMSRIHEGHLGLTKCLGRIRESVWWPNVTNYANNFVMRCETCARYRVQRQEPMIPSVTPDYPWQKIACDFFKWNGLNYLLVVDYLSRWIEIFHMSSTTAEHTINKLKSCFSTYGIAMEVYTDGGPQFTSREFSDFSKTYGFRHTTSSPYYSQSNGEAERAVQTVKLILSKCKESKGDVYLAMLSYRTAPLSNGLTPAEILFGRKIRSTVPWQQTASSPENQTSPRC